MTDHPMHEATARAIAERLTADRWRDMPAAVRFDYLEAAAGALTALLELTPDVVEAARAIAWRDSPYEPLNAHDDAAEIFTTMINHILGESAR